MKRLSDRDALKLITIGYMPVVMSGQYNGGGLTNTYGKSI